VTGPSVLPLHATLPHLSQAYNQAGSMFESLVDPSVQKPGWTLLGLGDDDEEDSRPNPAKQLEVPFRLYGQHIKNTLPDLTDLTDAPVAYLRISSFDLCDPMLLMHDIRMNTDAVLTSPRLGSENYCQVWSTLMKALLAPHPTGFIIDIRGNHGGLDLSSSIASFFGDDRAGTDGQYAVPTPRSYAMAQTQSCHSWNEEMKQRGIHSFRSTLERCHEFQRRVYVQENIKRYGPECVFQHGNVVILTDQCACSEGDEFPNWFLGDRFDRHIGANTQVYIVGEIDGSIKGGTFTDFNTTGLPVLSNRLTNKQGQAVSPIPVSRIENASAGLMSINGHFLSIQDRRTAPDVLLPNNAQVLWNDVGLGEGLIKSSDQAQQSQDQRPSPQRSGGVQFHDRSTWEDSALQTAIRVAVHGLDRSNKSNRSNS
ncbi:MAG: hypothetical protein Sylvanvirus45_3, partial [Sylvanvirus sp.]